MQLATNANNKPEGKENMAENNNSSSDNSSSNSSKSKGTFLLLLERIWNYRTPTKWVLFFFAVQVFVGWSAINLLFDGYKRHECLMYMVVGNVGFLYLWMLATGRTYIRIRTPEETATATPSKLLRVSGAVMLVSGILMAVGEQGVNSLAFGEKSRYSILFTVAAPSTFMVGVFNLVLASRTGATTSRFLALLALAVNAFAAFAGTVATLESRIFTRHLSYQGYGYQAFTNDLDFPAKWIEAHGADDALPFGAINNFNFLRLAPVYTTLILMAAVALMLLNALIKVGITKTEDKITKSKKRGKKHIIVAILGLAILITSFVFTKGFTDLFVALASYPRISPFHAIVPPALTALGLCAVAAGATGKFPTWSRGLLMVLAGCIFIFCYSFHGEIGRDYERLSTALDAASGSNCDDNSDPPTSYNYGSYNNYPPPPSPSWRDVSTTTVATTTENDDDEPKVCFQRVRNYGSKTKKDKIVCINLEQMCDGKVDLVDPVKICNKQADYFYNPTGGYVYLDEMLCPFGVAYNATVLITAVNWASIVLTLLMVIALAFTFGKSEEEEVKEKRVIVDMWDRFNGTLFTKVRHESDSGLKEEVCSDSPIIKKKIDSPC